MAGYIFGLKLSVIIHSGAASLSEKRSNRPAEETHLCKVIACCEELKRLGIDRVL